MKNDEEGHRVILEDSFYPVMEGKSATYLHNRYLMGKVEGKSLFVNKFELFFLAIKKRISMENGESPPERKLFIKLFEEKDIPMLKVFIDLKNSGGRVSIKGDSLILVGKNEARSKRRIIYPMRENQEISFDHLSKLDGSIIASVDDDGDITYYSVEHASLKGENRGLTDRPPIDRIGNRGIASSKDLPPWIGDSMGDVTVLSEQEMPFLNDKPPEDDIAAVYMHLLENGFIVRTGFKYGCNFRAYGGPMEQHAQFLVHVMRKTVQWYEISRAVRVAASVKKRMIFASPWEDTVGTIEVTRLKNVRDF